MRKADEEAVAPIDRTHNSAVDRDGSTGDPLENEAHELIRGTVQTVAEPAIYCAQPIVTAEGGDTKSARQLRGGYINDLPLVK